MRYCLVIIISILCSINGFSGDTTRNKYQQLNENLDQLSDEIQSRNKSGVDTEITIDQKFQPSFDPPSWNSMKQHQKELEAKQKQRNKWRLLRVILLVIVVVVSIVSRLGKKQRDKMQDKSTSNESTDQKE